MKRQNAINDVPGIRVGHAQNEEALTGCTVVLGSDLDAGLMAGVDQRGGAPGTRETDLLHPMHLVERAHAVLLSGGSAFGLNAAAGVMQCLEEQGAGFNAGVARVPIVPAAILFDLAVGDVTVRPDAAMGYQACHAALQAAEAASLATGNVGAGTGATVGKILGMGQAMKSGIGTASMEIGGGVVVGALVAVNAFGDVVDPATGRILAGARSIVRIGAPGYFADTLEVMKGVVGRLVLGVAARGHTILGVVATNARLTKSEINKVAQMAHDGVARAVRPAHTMLDGDTVFALSTGKRSADVSIVGAFAAEVMAQAIVGAVRSARPVAGLPACSEAQ
jgi:L-aminopeptidase/D-esterase-like protein